MKVAKLMGTGIRPAACAVIVMLVAITAPFCLAPSVSEMLQRFGPEAIERRHTHASVRVRVIGDGAKRVYLFIPSDPPLRGNAPVVLFHHGWQGMNPKNFAAWIDHLARSGQVVIYPVYQESARTSPQRVTAAAAAADKAALDALRTTEHLQIDPKRVVYFGYSMGAAISINLAIDPQRFGLPPPRALLLAAPGDAYHIATGAAAKSIVGKIGAIPSSLPVAVLAGAADTEIGLPTARALFGQMCHIQSDRRVLMILPSDEHDGHKVKAGHGSPGAPDSRYDFELKKRSFPERILGRRGFEASGSLNQLDFYGYWKVLDALIDDAAARTLPSVIFGPGTPEQLFLGTWPDGIPFKSLRIENPCPNAASEIAGQRNRSVSLSVSAVAY
jgi:dienelactone hydrolase